MAALDQLLQPAAGKLRRHRHQHLVEPQAVLQSMHGSLAHLDLGFLGGVGLVGNQGLGGWDH